MGGLLKMEKILKTCMWHVLRLLTAIILIMIASGVTIFLITMLDERVTSRYMALASVPMIPILVACFAANNPVRVRAWAALKTICVVSALAVVWGLLQSPIDENDIGGLMRQQYSSIMFMYLACFLSIIWTPSLAIKGSKPPPPEIYRFEKIFLGVWFLLSAYGYFAFDASMEMMKSSPMIDNEQLDLMKQMQPKNTVIGAVFMILLTFGLTRARFIIVRTLFLLTAILSVPGLLFSWFVFDQTIGLMLGGLVSSVLMLYCGWLLYKGPIADWAKEAKAEFNRQRLGEGTNIESNA